MAKKSSKKTAKKTSAGKKTPKKKVTRTSASAASDNHRPKRSTSSGSGAKRRKTPLSAKELRYFRELLLEKRAELVGDLSAMEDSTLRGQDRSNLSTMPMHMADVGSDNYDQELTLGLMESERKLLNEIDESLQRIEDKTYGVCDVTGEPIEKERLEIKPWAKYSIAAAREMERKSGGR